MASKLFRAVVSMGLSLGAATAACLGAVENPPSNGADADADAATEPVDDSGSALSDAELDAGDLDAFVFPDTSWCDAAWPVTKGNAPPPECVNPEGECAEAGMSPCFRTPPPGVGPHEARVCMFYERRFPFCIDGEWRCEPGRSSREDCTCLKEEAKNVCDGGNR
ncbi:MAG: hypothetical protein KF764_15805 [Labilithrix sp.]|nr:hypothetical protein [Labilithrix sp.]MBX3224463.1 hypothetical protein [Labilithrix sp.]